MVFLPRSGLCARWRRAEELRRRALIEDALKHLHVGELRGSLATPESVAGRLGQRLARTLELIAEMEARGLVRPSEFVSMLDLMFREIALNDVAAAVAAGG